MASEGRPVERVAAYIDGFNLYFGIRQHGRRSWDDYEEKESDVSLAVSLVEDGANNLFDAALIVSADSDMTPGIRALRRLVPCARVIAAMPPRRRSFGLSTASDAAFPISMTKVRQSQLPEVVTAGKHSFRRPAYWS